MTCIFIGYNISNPSQQMQQWLLHPETTKHGLSIFDPRDAAWLEIQPFLKAGKQHIQCLIKGEFVIEKGEKAGVKLVEQ